MLSIPSSMHQLPSLDYYLFNFQTASPTIHETVNHFPNEDHNHEFLLSDALQQESRVAVRSIFHHRPHSANNNAHHNDERSSQMAVGALQALKGIPSEVFHLSNCKILYPHHLPAQSSSWTSYLTRFRHIFVCRQIMQCAIDALSQIFVTSSSLSGNHLGCNSMQTFIASVNQILSYVDTSLDAISEQLANNSTFCISKLWEDTALHRSMIVDLFEVFASFELKRVPSIEIATFAYDQSEARRTKLCSLSSASRDVVAKYLEESTWIGSQLTDATDAGNLNHKTTAHSFPQGWDLLSFLCSKLELAFSSTTSLINQKNRVNLDYVRALVYYQLCHDVSLPLLAQLRISEASQTLAYPNTSDVLLAISANNMLQMNLSSRNKLLEDTIISHFWSLTQCLVSQTSMVDFGNSRMNVFPGLHPFGSAPEAPETEIIVGGLRQQVETSLQSLFLDGKHTAHVQKVDAKKVDQLLNRRQVLPSRPADSAIDLPANVEPHTTESTAPSHVTAERITNSPKRTIDGLLGPIEVEASLYEEAKHTLLQKYAKKDLVVEKRKQKAVWQVKRLKRLPIARKQITSLYFGDALEGDAPDKGLSPRCFLEVVIQSSNLPVASRDIKLEKRPVTPTLYEVGTLTVNVTNDHSASVSSFSGSAIITQHSESTAVLIDTTSASSSGVNVMTSDKNVSPETTEIVTKLEANNSDFGTVVTSKSLAEPTQVAQIMIELGPQPSLSIELGNVSSPITIPGTATMNGIKDDWFSFIATCIQQYNHSNGIRQEISVLPETIIRKHLLTSVVMLALHLNAFTLRDSMTKNCAFQKPFWSFGAALQGCVREASSGSVVGPIDVIAFQHKLMYERKYQKELLLSSHVVHSLFVKYELLHHIQVIRLLFMVSPEGCFLTDLCNFCFNNHALISGKSNSVHSYNNSLQRLWHPHTIAEAVLKCLVLLPKALRDTATNCLRIGVQYAPMEPTTVTSMTSGSYSGISVHRQEQPVVIFQHSRDRLIPGAYPYYLLLCNYDLQRNVNMLYNVPSPLSLYLGVLFAQVSQQRSSIGVVHYAKQVMDICLQHCAAKKVYLLLKCKRNADKDIHLMLHFVLHILSCLQQYYADRSICIFNTLRLKLAPTHHMLNSNVVYLSLQTFNRELENASFGLTFEEQVFIASKAIVHDIVLQLKWEVECLIDELRHVIAGLFAYANSEIEIGFVNLEWVPARYQQIVHRVSAVIAHCKLVNIDCIKVHATVLETYLV